MEFQNLKEIVNSFTDSQQLEEFTHFWGISEDPFVKSRILDLKSNELSIELELPSITQNVPSKQQGYGVSQPSTSSGSVSSYIKQKPYVLEKMSEKRFAKDVATDTKNRIKLPLNDSYWENKRLKDIHHDLDTIFVI